MIFITSRDGLIKDVNQAGVELLGYRSKQELLLLVSVEKVHDNPLHWKVFKKQIDRHGFVKDFEAGFKRKDGTRIHCLVSGNAVRDGDGEIIGYEGIVKDITARMDAIRNVKQRHRELSLLNPVALAMNMTQDLDDVLMTALKKVLEVLNLSCGSIFLIDHEMSAFSLKVQKGLPEGARSNTWQVSLHDHALMRSLLKKNLSLEPKPSFPPFRATLKGLRAHDSTELTCFLITAKEKASGFLALDLPLNRELTEQDTHLLGSLGNFLGGAIENTQLLRTIRKHREELKGLTAKLFQSQELERRRIARELHDEAGQALTAIKLGLDRLERYVTPESEYLKAEIREIRKIIVRTASEIRQLSSRLHPTLLNDLGLEPALNLYFKEVKKHSGLDIEFRMVGFDSRLDVDMETVLYRFSQEALTNTLKHSGADHFRLSIIKSFPKIIFFAGDDGIGFNGQIGGNDKRSLGLIGMRERASLLGGTFQLHARPAEGTRIRIEIPLAEARSHGSTD
jgi:PAS domain S-box-containing protein